MDISLRTTYRHMLNVVLPATYQQPVRYNHCFNRIVLDWLFQDVWYKHLDKGRSAISQLNNEQLHRMIGRMQQWLEDKNMLIEDNRASLRWRGKGR